MDVRIKDIRVMIKTTLSLVIALALVVISCTKATPAPTLTPTATPSFEQKRSDVLRYLQAYDNIDNKLDETVSAISLPKKTETAADLLALNAALSQYIVAIEGALSRLAELKPSALELETANHLEKAKTYLQTSRQRLEELKAAIAAGDQARIIAQINNLAASQAEASSVNRATEQLLLKYNIPDSEAYYRFRGK